VPADDVHPQVFRSTYWRGVAVFWVPVVAYTVWDVVRRDFPSSGIAALAVVGALTVLVYAVGWRPAVLADDQGVVVRNPFRTTTAPWGAVTDIDLTDALRVHTSLGITRAWSVDRGGAASHVVRGLSSRRMMANSGLERSAIQEMARRSPADYALATLVETWRRHRNASRGAAQTVWVWPVLVAFFVFAAAAVVLIVT
jgi:hypothetical protein